LKKIILLICVTFLIASPDKITAKIYENIMNNLSHNPKIWTDNYNLKNILKKYSNLDLTNKNSANIYILNKKIENINNKIIFVTNYKLLKDINNSVGAFYWKKGRPNIIFIKERLDKNGIKIPFEYKNYIENEKCLYELCF